MLFRSKKSQGSLQNISAGRSPLHSPIDSPLQSPAFPAPQSATYGPGQHTESANSSDPQHYQSSDDSQPHTAQSASRVSSQSTLTQGYPGQPTVNIVSGQSDENHPVPLTAESATNQDDRRQKRLTTRSLFNLYLSKDSSSYSSPQSPKLGRSVSTRKKVPLLESWERLLPPSTPTYSSGEGRPGDTCEETEASKGGRPSQINTVPDEQYHRQQDQFDSPESQTSAHSVNHYPDQEAQPHPQGPYHYHGRHPPRPSDTSSPYLPYNPQADRSSLEIHDPYRTLRPPSQHSLGPPSPVKSIQQPNDSGPSPHQARQTDQASQSSHLQSQAGMARGEGSNDAMRQQMAPQQQLGGEQSHGQYGSHQGNRLLQQQHSSMTDHGRSTPPPAKSREEISNLDVATLQQKLYELTAKYTKVKKYYFEKEDQVSKLQDTIANQRLSMSKTTLDDHEYTARFTRLDNAINNVSFNIRKEWKGVPPWLAAMVNRDAHYVGTKEMTAVGRACITRWVVDEILDRYFHPRIEPALSSQLKIVEKNIRRAGQHQVMSEAQRDDSIVRLTTWRLTTLEGLADGMAGQQGQEYEQQLTTNLIEKLTAALQVNLNDPPPPGLDTGVGMIIELAIGLSCALPMESRDVCVEYYMPGTPINETYMKMESGIPPLTIPGVITEYFAPSEPQQGDQVSTHSGDSNSVGENEGERENNGNGGLPARGDLQQGQGGNGGHVQQQQTRKDDSRKKGLFAGFASSKKASPPENNGSNAGLASTSNTKVGSSSSGVSLGGGKERESMEKADREGRIRFAAFVGVEVRGKGKEGGMVLVRAPCYGF